MKRMFTKKQIQEISKLVTEEITSIKEPSFYVGLGETFGDNQLKVAEGDTITSEESSLVDTLLSKIKNTQWIAYSSILLKVVQYSNDNGEITIRAGSMDSSFGGYYVAIDFIKADNYYECLIDEQ